MKVTVETVRELAEEVAGPLSAHFSCMDENGLEDPCFWERIVWHLQGAGILDARIVRGPCPTCGGSKSRERPVVVRGEIQTFSKEPCPDCADAPVWVIEPAALEAFVCGVICMEVVAFAELEPQPKTRAQAQECFDDWIAEFVAQPTFDDWWGSMEADAHKLLQALLPGARVAEEVLELHGTALGDEFDLASNKGAKLLHLTHGDTIAILAKQAREEVEDA